MGLSGSRPTVDERLWVVVEGCDEHHFILGNPHTHRGRMTSWCPRHQHRLYFSLREVVDASDLARAWIDGFLSGSEPRPEEMFGQGIHLLDDVHHPRWARWRAAVAAYRASGSWPHEPWRRLRPFPPGTELPPNPWTIRGDEVWSWDGSAWVLAEPRPALDFKSLVGSVCDERGHCDVAQVTPWHSVCAGCGHVSDDIDLPDELQVRRAVATDWAALRTLRIAAMTDAPNEFGSTLERELARSPDDWSRMLATGALFFLDRDGTPVGLAGGLTTDEGIELVSMWVAPDARGFGGGDALVQAVLAWADGRVRLYVVEGNERARRLYERNGFLPTGETWVRDRDGVVELVLST